MYVIKKDGRKQKFESEKIVVSILNATSESKELLNESDVKIIIEDIVELLCKLRTEDGNTSSYEIVGVVVAILKRDGFSDVIDKYLSYKRETV